MPAVKKVIFTTTGNFYPVTWEGNAGQTSRVDAKISFGVRQKITAKNQRV
jgi:hypothetical protein